ncbi:glutamine synthetase family protein [uncultured Eudoraea sp.]|uniref:glutamine synthetase family protein n=1 Tax=uncultured Eudoraea sp. TaxID=1035614 RepID=UPI00262BAA5E|nr:glutamine synthetase family protein [uncultured Eudoraea sp.]
MNIDELKKKVRSEEIETIIVAFTDHYGRSMGKRYDGDFFLESVVDSGSHACDYLLTTDMEMEPVQGYSFANWELGYGDFHLIPDMSSLRIAAWLDKTAIVLCDIHNEKNHSQVKVAPRSILNEQISKLKQSGFSAFAATELEYYLLENDYRSLHESNYGSLKPAGWYIEDYHILQGTRVEDFTASARKFLKNSGVPVENSKGEWGLGQHELNVQYAEPKEMADRHIIYKQCLKELADEMGISVTFMAKLQEGGAGSSCHTHISLFKGEDNIFNGTEEYGPVKGSKEFGSFLAGWIKYAPDVMVFYAPTINSYKRFVDGSWAPTRLAWSRDNRTAGFRVVGSGKSFRIECRIPGADCNPYLAIAASLASGLRGIEEKLSPPECFVGDVYAAEHLPHVPRTLKEACDIFSSSKFARDAFGKEVIDHYTHFYKQEIKAYESQVSDWERKRYFERI